MMLPQDWEGVASEMMRSREAEILHQRLLAQIPPASQPPFWRRWTGSSLVWLGSWLMRLGEQMAQRECRQGVSVVSS